MKDAEWRELTRRLADECRTDADADPEVVRLRGVVRALTRWLVVIVVLVVVLLVVALFLSSCSGPTGTGPDPCDDAATPATICGSRPDTNDGG